MTAFNGFAVIVAALAVAALLTYAWRISRGE